MWMLRVNEERKYENFLWLIKKGKEGVDFEEDENFNWNFEEIEI